MTSKAFTISFLLILLLTTVFKFYQIPSTFQFDYDQEQAANTAYDFLKLGKVSLVGQELSFKGFFVAPLHNLVNIVPYSACNLFADCVPFFFAAISTLTLIILFVVISKVFDKRLALIFSIIYGFSYYFVVQDRTPNSNYFLFLSQILIFYCLYKYQKGQDKFLLFAAFITGLATFNFNPIFIFSSVAFAIWAIWQKRPSLKIGLLAAFAFFINLAPLVLFNIRHQNILLKGIQNFASSNTDPGGFFVRIYNLVVEIVLPYFPFVLFHKSSAVYLAIAIIVVIFGAYNLYKINKKIFSLAVLWLIVPIIGFGIYKGHVSEYYFIQMLFPFLLIIAAAARSNTALMLAILFLFLLRNIYSLYDYRPGISYQVKKEAVSYILKNTGTQSFNVYTDMPPGMNTGYQYIFKAYEKTPQEGGVNTYLLLLEDPNKFQLEKHKKDYPGKYLSVVNFNFVHVVSVK